MQNVPVHLTHTPACQCQFGFLPPSLVVAADAIRCNRHSRDVVCREKKVLKSMSLDRKNYLCAEVRERPKQGNLFTIMSTKNPSQFSPIPLLKKPPILLFWNGIHYCFCLHSSSLQHCLHFPPSVDLFKIFGVPVSIEHSKCRMPVTAECVLADLGPTRHDSTMAAGSSSKTLGGLMKLLT